jgi:hypothetical protein
MSYKYKVTVFKPTYEDWFPCYSCPDLHNQLTKDMSPDLKPGLVKVSFLRTGANEDGPWRVCVWGNDDFGMEKDFPVEDKESAWKCFLEVISCEYIAKSWLANNQFVKA